MKNTLFMGDFPIETPISSGFPSLPRFMKPEGNPQFPVGPVPGTARLKRAPGLTLVTSHGVEDETGQACGKSHQHPSQRSWMHHDSQLHTEEFSFSQMEIELLKMIFRDNPGSSSRLWGDF